VLGTGVLSGAFPEAIEAQTPQAKIFGPSAAPIELTINGQRRSLSVQPRVTLLEALRDRLDLTGAKRVCDRASCGACTVIMDGSAVYSCSVLAIEAQGRSIQTVESLGSVTNLHPIQAAFVENDSQQCGFCTPGFVMACKALLDRHPNPTPDELRLGLGGNLCRCGTYVGMHKAIAQAAAARGGGGDKRGGGQREQNAPVLRLGAGGGSNG